MMDKYIKVWLYAPGSKSLPLDPQGLLHILRRSGWQDWRLPCHQWFAERIRAGMIWFSQVGQKSVTREMRMLKSQALEDNQEQELHTKCTSGYSCKNPSLNTFQYHLVLSTVEERNLRELALGDWSMFRHPAPAIRTHLRLSNARCQRQQSYSPLLRGPFMKVTTSSSASSVLEIGPPLVRWKIWNVQALI
jgi:hypothetical protein